MMKRAFKSVFLSILPLVLLSGWASAGEYFFRDGDRVVFLGDSITEQRLYTTYIEAYTLTRNPEWKLTFRNVGWGGDTAWLRQRAHPDERRLFAADDSTREIMVKDAVGRGLQRDVLPLKPTAVTVKFGMNDHSYQPFREDIFKAYVRSQTEIADVLKENGARVAFLTPQPIEDKRPDPDKDVRNESLRKFSDGLKEVAAKENALFVDQFDPFMKILLRERVDNPPTFIGGGGDAVHPGPAGHLVMAWVVLKGLGAGQLVSQAAIDCRANDGKAKACKITNLKIGDGTVNFDRLDDALPMPVDDRATAALKLAPILEELSRYELKIDGLAAGSYELTIDGDAAGKFTAEELAKGCNLTTQAGPITKQAGQVLSLVFKKNDVYFHRWRQVLLYEFPEWARIPETEKRKNEELDKLDKQVADLEAQIDQARKPLQRHFELKRI